MIRRVLSAVGRGVRKAFATSDTYTQQQQLDDDEAELWFLREQTRQLQQRTYNVQHDVQQAQQQLRWPPMMP